MGGPIIFSVSVRAYEGGVGQCCLRQAIGRARNVLEAALTGNSGMWRKMKAALVLPARTATSAASPTPLRQGSGAQSNRRHQNEGKEFGLRHVAPSILPPLGSWRLREFRNSAGADYWCGSSARHDLADSAGAKLGGMATTRCRTINLGNQLMLARARGTQRHCRSMPLSTPPEFADYPVRAPAPLQASNPMPPSHPSLSAHIPARGCVHRFVAGL